MSEKKMEVELKTEDRELLRSTIKKVDEFLVIQVKPAEHKHEEPKHEHFAVDLAYMEKGDACPDCVKGLDTFGKEYMKKTLEGRSKLPYICKDCGLGVKDDEEECPNCGGKDAEER